MGGTMSEGEGTAPVLDRRGAVEREALHQAAEGSWPVLPQERNWGTIGLFGVTLSAGIAAWSYSIGGAVSWYLGATMGTLAMIAGSLVGMYFVTLAAMPISVKYGIDTIAACKPQYGSYGAAFGIAAQFLSIVGWNCILIILLGRATANILVAGGVVGPEWKYASPLPSRWSPWPSSTAWLSAARTQCATTPSGLPWR
jgi:cytosine/uracil/thiamine/allantoin permease